MNRAASNTKAMLFRPQRTLLSEAMEEVKEFANKEDFISWLKDKYETITSASLEYYCFDNRIGWDS